jgi:two-component system phosphate regulon sensor histidine kinase PhoR
VGFRITFRTTSRGGSFFRKLLLSAFVLIAFALVLLDFYLTRYTAWRETRNVELRLAAEARLVGHDLARVPLSELGLAASEAGLRAETRITLISHSGVVLADSQHDPETMENHAGRPEVREALAGRTGASVRHSATLDRDLCYVAVPFTYLGQPGYVLRLAVPLTELSSAVAAVRRRIVSASAATAALALLLAYIFSRRIGGRIERIKRFAEQLSRSKSPEPLTPDSDDELGALCLALNDMGRQLRDSLERLKLESSQRNAILAGMVDGVLAVDGNMRVLFSNDAFAAATGTSAVRTKGAPLLEILRDSELFALLETALHATSPVTRRIHLAGAEDRVFDAHAARLFAEHSRGAVAVLHEITEIERLERVRRDFVANVSHELRTPLAAILGCAETLIEGAIDDPAVRSRFLDTIKAHATRLNNITADLLTLSELDAGIPAAPSAPFSLEEAIDSALRTVEAEARLRLVNLIRGPIRDIEILGYRLRLEQALVNLLHNAIKFNRPDGKVMIEARASQPGHVAISIADTGIGIPAQDLGRIFERFYRVDRARSRQVGGTGLGLAIVKHAVELMNGRVEVASQPGAGSTFTILIPVEVSPPPIRTHMLVSQR